MRGSNVLRQVSRAASSPSPLRSSAHPTSLSSSIAHRFSSTAARPQLAQRVQSSAWASRLQQQQQQQQQQRRGYADDTTAEKKSEESKGEGESTGDAAGELAKVKTELEAKNKEVVDMKDKYLRSVADFRNLQERAKRDQAQARDFAITRFAKDLVESIDNLDRAMGTVPADKLKESEGNTDLRNLYDGLKMTEQILMSTLAKHGLERFDPAVEAEKFDPNKHEAAFMTKIEGKEDGTVFNTMQKGFILNGRIIRAAKVGVVKNS